MTKDPEIFLKHILESIKWIEDFTENMTQEDFLNNVLVQDGTVRRLEIIGEATRNLPEDFRNAHNDVPWQDVAGMRSKLIHDYFGVDLSLVWNVVQNDLMPFKRQIEKILKS